MDLYSPGPVDDPRVFGLWLTLCETGDITFYDEDLQILSVFFQRMQAPMLLLYLERDSKIWFALWAEPHPMGVAIVNFWVAETDRHTQEAFRAVHEALTIVFHDQQTILAFTTQSRLVDLYTHFGMTPHTPRLSLGNRQLTMLSLTREDFGQARAPHLRSA